MRGGAQPRLEAFFLLNKFPTTVPQKLPQDLGPLYKHVYQMPQSGFLYDREVGKDVQLYVYVNASDLLLSTATTVCIFLYGVRLRVAV